MNSLLTIQERIKDLRVENNLTLEQLAEKTGLSSSALGNYETNEYKDVSHFAIIKLAKFYGVTTDYLLGFSETKKHSKTDINSLHLSDELIELLQQGKINIPLFCELATHKDFPKLLADIEIYVNRFASKMIGFLNSFVDAGREQILAKAKPLQPDNILNLLSNISIDEPSPPFMSGRLIPLPAVHAHTFFRASREKQAISARTGMACRLVCKVTCAPSCAWSR